MHFPEGGLKRLWSEDSQQKQLEPLRPWPGVLVTFAYQKQFDLILEERI